MIRETDTTLTGPQLRVVNSTLWGLSHLLDVGLWADLTEDEQASINGMIVAMHRITRERAKEAARNGATKER